MLVAKCLVVAKQFLLGILDVKLLVVVKQFFFKNWLQTAWRLLPRILVVK